MKAKIKYIFIGLLAILALSWFFINNQESANMNSIFIEKIKDGDIIFSALNTDNRALNDFNKFGVIEKKLGEIYVWDNQNTIKKSLSEWSKNGEIFKVYRITHPDFNINTLELQNGTYNHIMNSDVLEFIIENK
ncbi:hypothetical protein BTO15_16030 [Polaribacter sejongensis]|uniref:Uncharacterized protein n=1 Tax=Polaribacter sejongensis TaxID=985043 RepID=A0ABN5F9M1_9FLAO|nr:hypothetical protein [Polaribacter sejongensis]AUC23515.1 hypothetical protein BTO15_16030 [Polaribacter sejongensis]